MWHRCTVLGTIVCAITLGLGTAPLEAQTAPPTPVTSMSDAYWTKSQEDVRPWTREEMLNAVADDIPGVSDLDIALWGDESADRVYDKSGGPGEIPSGGPADGLGARAGELEKDSEGPAAYDAPGLKPRSYTYPAPFTRYETFPSYTNYPHSTVGKVFFTKPGIGDYVCSAASIGGDAVFTAAHCVQDGKTGTYWTNWVFVPAYKNGNAPLGQWTANHLWVDGRWVNGNKGDFRFDVGGAVLNRRLGAKISTRVGWLGFLWNRSANAHWTAIGYPQDPPFNGRLQQICQGSYAYSTGASPAPNAIGCDQTGGASGGPWIRSYSKAAGQSNFLNGVHSFKRCTNGPCTTVRDKEMFSPYFDANTKRLRDCLVNSVPGNPADPAQGCGVGT